MSIARFRVKYPRPKKLSDPYSDWTLDLREQLLAIPDYRLTGHEYRKLLGPFLPAANYEEGMYFLPLAFRYLLSHDANSEDLTTSLIWFSSVHKNQLTKDKYLETVRECLRELLDTWTSEFVVTHVKRETSNIKPHSYADYVKNSHTIRKTLNDLVEFSVYADLAERFVWDISYIDDPIKNAWFIEFASHRNSKLESPPKYEAIPFLINDIELLRRAAKIVREHLVNQEKSPTYWRDTFKQLNL